MILGVDGYIYMFAAIQQTTPGVKVARVPQSNVADRTKVLYFSIAISPPGLQTLHRLIISAIIVYLLEW